jgi:hypothetical protein
MVGRNGLFSGYKSQITKGHKADGRRKKSRTEKKKKETEPGGRLYRGEQNLCPCFF